MDTPDNPEILTLQGVSVRFGGVRALSGIDLSLRRGELLGLIGPNGAGKTTLLNLISGAMAPTTGTIHLNGRPIAGLSPDKLCHLGVSRTFQNIRLFPKMTVFENVALGMHAPAPLLPRRRPVLHPPGPALRSPDGGACQRPAGPGRPGGGPGQARRGPAVRHAAAP